MPKIIPTVASAQFRCPVNRRVLENFQSAVRQAEQAGLRVDITTDVEQMLRRLEKVINDAAAEATPTGSTHTVL